MILINLKRHILSLDFLDLILCFALSFLLISSIIIQTWFFSKPSDVYGLGLILMEDLKSVEFGVAEAADITHRVLWHTTGLPDYKLSRPQGFCLDPDSSRIYVADTDNDRIIIFGMDGEVIGPFFTSRRIKRPFDLIIGPDSQIYISQKGEKTIEVFNKKGVWQTSIPKDPKGEGLELAPGRMVFDRKGRLLVNDRSTGAVCFMTRDGKVLKMQYVAQKAKGSKLLTGLDIDMNGSIYVIKALGSPVITVMDPEGGQTFSFGRHGALYEDSFSFPSNLAVDDKGRIWVVDAFRHTIKVFGPNKEYLFNIGALGEQPGEFVFPVDIDIDKEGRLYVLEKGAGRLQALSVILEGAE